MADGRLVTLALNGDRKAFPLLMDRYGGKLHRVIARRLPTPEDVGDVLQDTFACAWAALHSYSVAQPFEPWLVSIALNKCRDWGRRRSVRQRAAIYLQDFGPSEGIAAEDLIMRAQAHDGLADALRQLPASLRDPLVMTTLTDLTQREAADRLGISPKAVELRVRRAKQRLRDLLP